MACSDKKIPKAYGFKEKNYENPSKNLNRFILREVPFPLPKEVALTPTADQIFHSQS